MNATLTLGLFPLALAGLVLPALLAMPGAFVLPLAALIFTLSSLAG